ncbi:AraC family transcriptional regulator [Mucilaginibacter sp. OK098]|uniref:AraC family transcriptional regulator n=1 Tax=Mucilaginibacter sp. OK098 TaxID=1855297 RepID=UPI000918A898|nr:helix-turn-helix domain-containing protein [Mucilaginibacter sp. OK098]SHN01059.1 AraC-type DNA-binding protein [Mucilaginibacter sp. OK098]
MNITHYAPAHPLLKPFIAEIYLLERHEKEPPEHYLAFPGVNHFITINQSAVCRATDFQVSLTHQAGCDPSGLLISNFGEPHSWSYEGPIQEWNICFKPLGINHFVDIKPGDLSQENVFADFNYFADFTAHINTLYSLSDNNKKVHSIENYWLSKLRNFNHPFLHSLMNEILENEGQRLNFSNLALRFKVSRDTLHTSFKRYVGTSPARFEKVLRFRHALATYRLSGQSTSLTNVSGQAAYFDQSHMIRDFRSFTGLTPKDFYKKIASFPRGDINWIFSDKHTAASSS